MTRREILKRLRRLFGIDSNGAIETIRDFDSGLRENELIDEALRAVEADFPKALAISRIIDAAREIRRAEKIPIELGYRSEILKIVRKIFADLSLCRVRGEAATVEFLVAAGARRDDDSASVDVLAPAPDTVSATAVVAFDRGGSIASKTRYTFLRDDIDRAVHAKLRSCYPTGFDRILDETARALDNAWMRIANEAPTQEKVASALGAAFDRGRGPRRPLSPAALLLIHAELTKSDQPWHVARLLEVLNGNSL